MEIKRPGEVQIFDSAIVEPPVSISIGYGMRTLTMYSTCRLYKSTWRAHLA